MKYIKSKRLQLRKVVHFQIFSKLGNTGSRISFLVKFQTFLCKNFLGNLPKVPRTPVLLAHDKRSTTIHALIISFFACLKHADRGITALIALKS